VKDLNAKREITMKTQASLLDRLRTFPYRTGAEFKKIEGIESMVKH
jgi:hypothetical protein